MSRHILYPRARDIKTTKKHHGNGAVRGHVNIGRRFMMFCAAYLGSMGYGLWAVV